MTDGEDFGLLFDFRNEVKYGKSFFLRLRLRLKEEWLRFLAKTEDCAKLRQMQLFILVWVETFMLQTIIL